MSFRTKILTAAAACMVSVGGMIASSAAAADVSVETARGGVTVAANPAKVVVFDLGVLDTLTALEVPVAGVPGSNLPPSLEKYKADSYAKVGSLFEPDYEAINALKPDLIIIGGRSAAKYDDLAKIAPVIDLTTDPENFGGSVERNATTLGQIFGKEAEVKERIARLQSSTAELKTKAAGIGKGLVVLTTGGKISAYGPGSRFGEIHGRFGVAAADPDLKVATHGQVVSYEYILEKNPDWLFVIDRDAAIGQKNGQSAQQLLDNALVHNTNAWKNNHVVYLDPVKMYLTSAGLATEQGIVDEISAAIETKS